MQARRLIRREDTVRRKRSYVSSSTTKEVITPDTYTPILATEIIPETQSSINIFVSASVAVKDITGYGKVRVVWTQGGLTHTIGESEGKILPLGGEEYHRDLVVTGLTLSAAVGVSLEGAPEGATIAFDNAVLYTEEW